jgi:PIN domain nuclease of toxin-antitoxin system
VILLDTNALLWLETRHKRVVRLATLGPFSISPATLLELTFLVECGKIKLSAGRVVNDLGEDPRWRVDEPPVRRWFDAAHALAWTRDPFDRLIAAHAIARGWRLATGDTKILDALGPERTFAL